jgi:glutaconate CoA-transferase subunit A
VSVFCSLRQAIGRSVHDGDVVAMEGFTHLIPFAAGHEVIRQQRRNLTLVRMTPDVIYDQLIGAGCASRLAFSWGGNPGVGSLHRLRDAVEHGWPTSLPLDEYSHAAMANASDAGAANLPFAAFRTHAGSLADVNPSYRTVLCPFTGETLVAVPALRLDVQRTRSSSALPDEARKRRSHSLSPLCAIPRSAGGSIDGQSSRRSGPGIIWASPHSSWPG